MFFKLMITCAASIATGWAVMSFCNTHRARTISLTCTYMGTLLCVLSITGSNFMKAGNSAIAVIADEKVIWFGLGLIMVGFYVELTHHLERDA